MSLPLFDALVALAGKGGGHDYFSSWLIQGSRLLLAADGGAALLAAKGCQAHLVIGDMDSLPESFLGEEASRLRRIVFSKDKDFSDGELATAAAVLLARGLNLEDPVFQSKDGGRTLYEAFSGTDLSGLTLAYLNPVGLRYDHFLASLDLARILVLRGARVFMTDGTSLARIIKGPCNLEEVFPPSAFEEARKLDPDQAFHFSALPLDDGVRRLSLTGLHWELKEVDLPRGRSLALSNRARGLYPDKVSLALEGGSLLLLTYPEGL